MRGPDHENRFVMAGHCSPDVPVIAGAGAGAGAVVGAGAGAVVDMAAVAAVAVMAAGMRHDDPVMHPLGNGT